ncbi:hypothetical protein NHF50_01965 [Flavobacterium sp. NRK F10]|uniref:hypothetical protein n=1 Tax=Flavobacterium sp. NRK F10 TaxID=2954931 RepID=UPI002091A673|nr:hypothetical protein [Flavobacterium sp. NRK F10]MCO6173804.1 hypothetical protein [Flavobacterium sp. NRK F10]
MKKICVGFLLSYDYEKLKISIPLVYRDSDRIFIAIDRDNLTWSGNKFEVNESFFEWLKTFDVDNKIELYYESFYVPSLSTEEMDTRERTMLSEKMGIGNWLIQVDCDEYFVDFAGFVKQLRKYDHYLDFPIKDKIQIAAFWVIIYKYTEKGFLYVDKPMKAIFATNYPNYKSFRRTHERTIYLDNLVLHESVARTEEELEFKLKNWGHNTQVNETFLAKWKKVDETNYKELKDFYYIEPERWKTLGFFPVKELSEINFYTNKDKKLKLTKSFLFFKNFGQWFKFRILKPISSKDKN